MADVEFVDGLIAKEPNSNAPDFIKCAISIKRKDLGNWLRKQEGDWINIDVKESKGGKWYAAVNDFKPEKQGSNSQSKPQDDPFDDESIPF